MLPLQAVVFLALVKWAIGQGVLDTGKQTPDGVLICAWLAPAISGGKVTSAAHSGHPSIAQVSSEERWAQSGLASHPRPLGT